MNGGLPVVSATNNKTHALIDIRVPIQTKINSSYYNFIKKLLILVMKLFAGHDLTRLHQTIRDELQGSNKIKDDTL